MKENKHIEEFFSAIAPKWDSFENHDKAYLESLFDSFSIQKEDKVLDLACGTGVIEEYLLKRVNKVDAIDISPEMIEIAKKKYPLDKVNYQAIDFFDYDKDEYDIVLIFNAYPHFVNKERFALQLHKVLKKGGRFIILHDLSRQRLTAHHSTVPHNISFELSPVEEEGKYLEDRFTLLRKEEDERHYLIIGEKK